MRFFFLMCPVKTIKSNNSERWLKWKFYLSLAIINCTPSRGGCVSHGGLKEEQARSKGVFHTPITTCSILIYMEPQFSLANSNCPAQGVLFPRNAFAQETQS